MIIDTSAIMAILLAEPEREAFTRIIFSASDPMMSTATSVELAAVIIRRKPHLSEAADRLIRTASITLSPLSIEQAKIAAEAYARFGRGTRHPAKLNFGDCFSYALAKDTGQPLLYKGKDFKKTDIAAAA